MYASDNGGRFCYSSYAFFSQGPEKWWVNNLFNYDRRKRAILLCPSAPKTKTEFHGGRADAAWSWWESEFGPLIYGSYGINGSLSLLENNQAAPYYFYRDTAVQHPAQTPMFFDCVWYACDVTETDPPSRNLYEPYLANNSPGYIGICLCATARHGNRPASAAPRNVTSGVLPGSINMGFVDGHAQSVKLEKLWTLYWHNRWDPNKVPPPHPAPK